MKSTKIEELQVTSHVARDLLQSAGLFKNDRLVVWEYVSNGLQYVDSGTNPFVRVKLDQKHRRIVVTDNGAGMDAQGLRNYFVMHGENLDRKKGRPGRGRFGTGKSAAFGIADTLTITTVRNGRRSKVQLTRQLVESCAGGEGIPLKVIENEVSTEEANGTSIAIEGIHLRRLDRAGIIQYIERHLAKWRGNATVFVNNHECEYHEPPIADIKTFSPQGELAEKLGEVELVVKVATSALEQEARGIDILSNGVWHETTLGSLEGKEMSEYIFGELDVPALESEDSKISPFDQSRSMQLNVNNPLVRVIHAFVSDRVDEVRKELVRAERERRKGEEAKKLQETADKIAEILNEDFSLFRQKLSKVRARGVGGSDSGPQVDTNDQESDITAGDQLPAIFDGDIGDSGVTEDGTRENGNGEPRQLGPQVREAPDDAPKRGKPSGGAGKKRRGGGGFSVHFERMGAEERRAKYIRDRRAINVNLDHPQVSAALGKGRTDDPMFRRLAYEVALAEYSIAIHMELALADQYLDLTDPIFDIQDTMDRISRRTAALYADGGK